MKNNVNNNVKNSIRNIGVYSQLSSNAYNNEMDNLEIALNSKSNEDIAIYLASQAFRKTFDSLKRREEKKLKELREELKSTLL
ncbi:MAG: hypothetical protein IKY26_02780 [Erysipelotrichaceae bacterium]|nr:hypothetical protein [Erysipelotrichaceae bacterium]